VSRLDDLRDEYRILGELLKGSEGSDAAAIVRARRMIWADIELAEASEGEEVPFVDQLAAKRAAAGVVRPPSRRRQSG
jgi:hypothetical protein